MTLRDLARHDTGKASMASPLGGSGAQPPSVRYG